MKEKSETDTTERERAAKELEQSMNTVKEIITIIMALAFTNTIIQFFVTTDANSMYTGKDISDFDRTNVWILFLIITTIIRFHHGNSLHLNKKYSKNELISTNMPNFSPALCLIFFFSEGFIFALMSVYQSKFEYLFWMFVVLFLIDFLLFSCMGLNARILVVSDAETRWAAINCATTISLLILWACRDWISFTYAVLVLITINLLVDYISNWKYYFPPIPKT